MAKVYNFTRKDKNRYRKVYRFIRKKPVYEYTSSEEFEMIAGEVSFSNSSGPQVYNFPSTISFTNIPVVTVTAVDSEGNNQANVNAYITAVNTASVSISVSSPFTGKVHFIIVGQD
jgi:plastocyanin domain-containing protein